MTPPIPPGGPEPVPEPFSPLLPLGSALSATAEAAAMIDLSTYRYAGQPTPVGRTRTGRFLRRRLRPILEELAQEIAVSIHAVAEGRAFDADAKELAKDCEQRIEQVRHLLNQAYREQVNR